MKTTLTMCLLLVAEIAAASPWADLRAAYDAHLVLRQDPEAMVGRELLDGMWLGGGQKPLAAVTRRSDDREVAHLSAFWLSRLEGQDTLYGPAVGINVGPALRAAAEQLPGLGELAGMSVPPFVSKLGEVTSAEFFAGYRHVVSPDDHHWGYGIGAKVRIPINDVIAWARGSGNEKGL